MATKADAEHPRVRFEQLLPCALRAAVITRQGERAVEGTLKTVFVGSAGDGAAIPDHARAVLTCGAG